MCHKLRRRLCSKNGRPPDEEDDVSNDTNKKTTTHKTVSLTTFWIHHHWPVIPIHLQKNHWRRLQRYLWQAGCPDDSTKALEMRTPHKWTELNWSIIAFYNISPGNISAVSSYNSQFSYHVGKQPTSSLSKHRRLANSPLTLAAWYFTYLQITGKPKHTAIQLPIQNFCTPRKRRSK